MLHAVSSTRAHAIGAALVAMLITALELVEVPLAFAAQDAYLEAAELGESSLDVWTTYDAMAFPWLFAGIAAYVLTCLWLYRVRTNVDITHRGAHHARKKGWVWGGWVVPVVAVWFPFQIVRDLLKAQRGSAPTALLGWWWGFWLVTNITAQIGPQLIGLDEIDTASVEFLGIAEGVDATLNLVALILWLAIIRRIDLAQRTSTSPPDQSPVSAVA
jgi:hypothetical protein